MIKKKTGAAADSSTLRKIAASIGNQELVAVIGSGVSLALTEAKVPTLSWRGLIEDGFAYAVSKGRMSEGQAQTWSTQLESSDMDELLLAAEFVGRKLEAPAGDLYARWLKRVFEQVPATNRAMARAIAAFQPAGIPLCTLNYDFLLEQVTGLSTVRLTDSIQVNEWMLRHKPGILHLHGCWDVPESCMLGIRDYESTLRNEVRDLIQRSLGAFKRLLFIGCGDTFSDPNFQALVAWLRKNMRAATPQHYALVSDKEVAARHADPHWQGFVEPLSYGADHKSLPDFLQELLPVQAKPNIKRDAAVSITPSRDRDYEKVLKAYKSFLLKDCGEMTFEGVRADMDMAQRKFNLERLFVPLSVIPTVADTFATEPRVDLQRFRHLGDDAAAKVPFGKIFARRKRLALLALPGAGKSLLLKRLAVAYCDDARRQIGSDEIPAMNVVPVLIRCREWREYIRLPIPTMLRKMPEITGHSVLAGFWEALQPQLKRGQVLLLVDGMDEIHSDADRATFAEHLESFLSEFKQIRLVVTSREAGFNLVAPGLARFCKRFRIAPLDIRDIRALCGHWHRLIAGDTPESEREAHDLASQIERNTALHRLAENPLLLTMILVVKHGAGRLPPDRVTLYGRAVEVLLDTWNIKGHTPLNSKEAVPQLAYVAFELTRAGKQTATEKELLRLLEDARERVPQIRLYARDTPADFLRRVELRSSLLVEGGSVSEGGRTVPFYQFRHLTFQEYLTAVAVVDGHYVEYSTTHTILTPLQPFLTSPEWKEVIPMAAVLAGKRAEPLLAALVRAAASQVPKGAVESDDLELADSGSNDAVDRLLHGLLEEAQAAPETISAALRLIVRHSGQEEKASLIALTRGPYGKELLQQAASIYRDMDWAPAEVDITFAVIAGAREPQSRWLSPKGLQMLEQQTDSADDNEVILGLMTVIGVWWISNDMSERPFPIALYMQAEKHLYDDDPAVINIAAWVFGVAYSNYREHTKAPTVAVLDRLLLLWLASYPPSVHNTAALALSSMFGLPRSWWTPSLTAEQIEKIRSIEPGEAEPNDFDAGAVAVIAFHSKSVFSDAEVAERMSDLKEFGSGSDWLYVQQSLAELGAVGRKYLRRKRRRRSRSAIPDD